MDRGFAELIAALTKEGHPEMAMRIAAVAIKAPYGDKEGDLPIALLNDIDKASESMLRKLSKPALEFFGNLVLQKSNANGDELPRQLPKEAAERFEARLRHELPKLLNEIGEYFNLFDHLKKS